MAEAVWAAEALELQGDVWQWTSTPDDFQDDAYAVFGGPTTVSIGLVGLSRDGFTAMLRATATPPFVGVRCALDVDEAVELAIEAEYR